MIKLRSNTSYSLLSAGSTLTSLSAGCLPSMQVLDRVRAQGGLARRSADRSHTMPWPSTLAPPAPPATASLFTHDGATLAYALPAAVPRALLLVAHGCRNSGRNWFTSAPAFGSPVRSSLPEESCVTAYAIAAGFAVLAPGVVACQLVHVVHALHDLRPEQVPSNPQIAT